MRRLALLLLLLFTLDTRAELISYHNANPVGWMHLLPVGETPGWSTPMWVNIELNQANIWSTPFTMTDKRNGDVYSYRADFEQSSAIADIGFAILPNLAFAVEVPYANRNGGFLDDFIDQFHIAIQTDRFERNDYPKYHNSYSITKNGQSILNSQHAEGVGGFKTKLKYWLWQKRAAKPGICDCGLALSAQVKFPVRGSYGGLSSGSYDYTGMINFGLPFWQNSGFWLSAAVTKLGNIPMFAGWPMRSWSQMYEAAVNLGLSENWGLLMQGRFESPLFRAEDLNFNYTYTDTRDRSMERINSSWNSLVYWRGSESIGFRYLLGKNGTQANFLFVEDWGLGKYDSTGGWTYINNAPDVEFITQWHFVF
jgi:hypothetical protein